MTSTEDWHAITLEIPFASHKHAMIAKQTIEVDSELQPHAVKRTLSVEDNVLTAEFLTRTIRLARLTVNGFLENVDLVVRTLEAFGEDAEQKPDQ
ncbi:transcription factor Pcc1-domain-containing protein [Mucidula mucida]|nr:transcription factor Pcc1-domain-containing protein [Mucidula mucida]